MERSLFAVPETIDAPLDVDVVVEVDDVDVADGATPDAAVRLVGIVTLDS
jgi:hypothetical protein